jgi:hypothetical protein
MKRTLRTIGLVLAAGLWMTVSLPAHDAGMPDAEFMKLAKAHDTAATHEKLAAHYTTHAAEHEQDAKEHEELAALYAKSEPRLSAEAKHYATHSKEAAEALRNLAKIHTDLAKEHGAKGGKTK